MFAGLSGIVKLDQNADRIANYRIWHLPKDGDAYVDFVDIEMIDSTTGVITDSQSLLDISLSIFTIDKISTSKFLLLPFMI